MALLHDSTPAPPSRATAVEDAPRRTRLPAVALYSTTLALSAALVFMVQPMFARFVLPLLGGTPAVWTTAMLFFQTALLLAYLYAHWATRRFGARRQAALHLALVAAALLFVPIGVPDGWTPPDSSSPVPWLLLLLLVAVGLPFFVVSATAPLLQSWLAETDHPDAGDPYFLYRASNVGSVLGLLSYPLLVERELTLDGQSWLWSGGYVLLAVLLAGCAAVLWRAGRVLAPAGASIARDGRAALERIGRGRRVRWVALAFVPSSLMLGVTTALTTNVAPVPLLWVLPLSLYLLSFILVFSRGEGAGPFQRVALLLMPPAAVVLAGAITIGITEPLWLIVSIHLVAFFFIALACHGELAADRPPAAQLTEFYAFVSLGGALGGVFNVMVAPHVFNSLTEYPLVLALACFLLPMRLGSWSDQMSVRRHLLAPVALGGAGTAALLLTEGAETEHRVAYLVLGLLCVAMMRNSLRFGLGVGLAMVAVWIPTLDNVDVVYQDRGFFGVKRVEAEFGGLVHKLKNGTIVHGAQIGGVGIDPVTYYHRTGPMGQLLQALPDRSVAERAGIIGLGAGNMACLSGPADRWTFFEIDPAVVKIARQPKLFSFLRDCKGKFDVVLGDGRLSLERQKERFGLIALDAFSSDAIPIHLLTREALDLYLARLSPQGVLAFHISNNYLDLEPVVGNLAKATGLACYAQQDTVVTRETLLKYPSHWAVLARSPEHLGKVRGDRRWQSCRQDPSARTWSDDYSNVLGIVSWN